MKFAHLADVHIGAWRDPKMAGLPDQAFHEAISVAMAEEVDFIIIAGDLFNTAVPGIDHLRSAVKALQAAKEARIPIYIIPGSHDFSASGKSMLHVLEEAGLVKDVFKGTIMDGRLRLEITKDPKTGCVLTGILGKKGMLDRQHYESLDEESLRSRIEGEKHKIFLFHTSLQELKPKHLDSMEAAPISMLPKGFDYYAGGHVHVVGSTTMEGYPLVVYPGPVFPASFSELESLKEGNMVIVEDGAQRNVPLRLKPVVALRITIDHETATTATDTITAAMEGESLEDAIVLLRITGTLREGTAAAIDFKHVFATAYKKGAFFVMRNTAKLHTETAAVSGATERSTTAIEEELINESVGKVASPFGDREAAIAKALLHGLSADKAEGETNTSYEERMLGEAKRILGLEQAE